MQPQLSILIITYNRPADLVELLENLCLQTNYSNVVKEVFILNNASTENYDAVANYISQHPELRIKYIPNDANIGVARGRNKLLQIATGDVLLSLDDDMVFTKENDLETLAGLFEQDYFKAANAGIITFRVIYYENREVQITAFPHKQYEKYAVHPRFMTYYFAGGAHIMKREVLAKTGLYPEDFHYGMEEYDLSYRVLDAGYTLAYDNGVTVAHKESPLGRQPSYQKLQMQWVNKSKVAWRYLPFKYFVTTAGSWALQFVLHAGWHPLAFFSAVGQILKIPFTEKRHVISQKALDYLKKTEARLKY